MLLIQRVLAASLQKATGLAGDASAALHVIFLIKLALVTGLVSIGVICIPSCASSLRVNTLFLFLQEESSRFHPVVCSRFAN